MIDKKILLVLETILIKLNQYQYFCTDQGHGEILKEIVIMKLE